MLRTIAVLVTACSWAVAADNVFPPCPAASQPIQSSCREITLKDLPRGATALLRRLQCEVGAGSNYDYGSAVDLNGDGSPEYVVCCHEYPHGPCAAILIAKVGNHWRDLTAKKGGLRGFIGACNLFVVLDSQHGGFHDVCIPDGCAPGTGTGGKPCAASIWHFGDSRYR